ncbi:MAG: S1/P1 nuclease [Bacteroidota bacterium]
MKGRWIYGSLLAVAVTLAVVRPLAGWGFWAHKQINSFAIRSLPAGIREFFSAHADSIVEYSILADLRRDEEDQEQYNHYIDIDRYGTYPFSELPRDMKEAQAKYGVDSVRNNGIVPWRITSLLGQLTESMKMKNTREIILYAADLGHYVADVHMPLHTTENYDGQLTGQVGVHWRFESELTERFGMSYNLAAGKAEYIEDPLTFVFEMVAESYLLVDSVLHADTKAKEGIPKGELYQIVKKHGRNEYHYSSLYYDRFKVFVSGLAERRMRTAVHRLASFWYTAWVNAGRPKLSDG